MQRSSDKGVTGNSVHRLFCEDDTMKFDAKKDVKRIIVICLALHMLYRKYQQQTLFIMTNTPVEVCEAIS